MKSCRLLELADKPKKLVSVLKKRLAAIDRSVNELCAATNVRWSTIWRWEEQGAKPNVSTLIKLDIQLKQWEAAYRRKKRQVKIENPNALA